MRPLFLLILWCATLAPAQARLTVYYLRHAESGANVAGQWKDTPKDQRPAYVGNANAFSPLGEQQRDGVAAKLKVRTYDVIAVSPLWRTRHTILPYLVATGKTAELWPELAEYSARGPEPLPTPLPAPSTHLFGGGKPIALPPDEAPRFVIRPDAPHEFALGQGPAQQEADRLALAQRVIELLRQRSQSGDTTVLLVGHGNSGRVLLSVLCQDASLLTRPETVLKNATLWRAEEQPDGRFQLTLLNDQPWPPAPR